MGEHEKYIENRNNDYRRDNNYERIIIKKENDLHIPNKRRSSEDTISHSIKKKKFSSKHRENSSSRESSLEKPLPSREEILQKEKEALMKKLAAKLKAGKKVSCKVESEKIKAERTPEMSTTPILEHQSPARSIKQEAKGQDSMTPPDK